MRRGDLILRAIVAALLLGSIAVGLLLLLPAVNRIDSAAEQSVGLRARLDGLQNSSVGETYEREVASYVSQRLGKVGEIDLARSHLAGKLDASFPGAKIAEGASWPTPDEFQRAYNFHIDQFRNKIRDLVGRAGGPEAREIPLLTPPFGSGPMDAATMAKWQRSANIEARVLETAAKSGAPPVSMLKLETEPAPADDPDVTYERIRIGLEVLCPEGRTSLLIHQLLAGFDEAGGVVKLLGLAEAPMAEASLREATGPPAKRLTLSLSLGFPSPRSEQPK